MEMADVIAAITSFATLAHKVYSVYSSYKYVLAFLEHSRQLRRKTKRKVGLLGFVNGTKTSALADTGAKMNVVSEAFARKMKLAVSPSSITFQLGNSRKVTSIGTSFLFTPARRLSLVTCSTIDPRHRIPGLVLPRRTVAKVQYRMRSTLAMHIRPDTGPKLPFRNGDNDNILAPSKTMRLSSVQGIPFRISGRRKTVSTRVYRARKHPCHGPSRLGGRAECHGLRLCSQKRFPHLIKSQEQGQPPVC